jgi:hypothetical protein
MSDQAPCYIPSPIEIISACHRIRTQWTESQRVKRIMDDSTRRGEAGIVELPVIQGSLSEEDVGPGLTWRYRRRAVLRDV